MDRAVQKTDTDAAQSKVSAVEKGYYQDKYLKKFCASAPARFPLINIGTYCRVKACDILLDRFLEREGPKQIISLGAGSDTRPFHLIPNHKNLIYYELDFPVKAKQKIKTVLQDPELREIIGEAVTKDGNLHSLQYHMLAQDLRSMTGVMAEDIPTLVLSECCLCYLSPEDSQRVLQLFCSKFSTLSLVLYEPIGLNDEFGRVMMENLAYRGLSLPTFRKFNTLDAQKQRLADLGLENPQACDILEVYEQWLKNDRARISKIEFLDEVEEMNLLLSHYSIVWC